MVALNPQGKSAERLDMDSQFVASNFGISFFFERKAGALPDHIRRRRMRYITVVVLHK